MAACNVCLKRVLPHSYFLACNLCNSKIHINCMHKVTKNDSIYTQKEEHTWFCTDCVGNIFPYCHLYEDDEFMSALSENWNTKTKFLWKPYKIKITYSHHLNLMKFQTPHCMMQTQIFNFIKTNVTDSMTPFM